MATAIYAVLDPTHRTVVMSAAGPLPPVLLDGSGEAGRLNLPADLPLGSHPRAPRRITTHELPPGSTLLMYTDGLVERRGQPLDQGIDALLKTTGAGTA